MTHIRNRWPQYRQIRLPMCSYTGWGDFMDEVLRSFYRRIGVPLEYIGIGPTPTGRFSASDTNLSTPRSPDDQSS